MFARLRRLVSPLGCGFAVILIIGGCSSAPPRTTATSTAATSTAAASTATPTSAATTATPTSAATTASSTSAATVPTATVPTATVPTAAQLLTAAATAMAGLTSAHFTLIVRGKLPDLKVQGAAGDLTSVGDARGTAKMTQFEQLVEVDFVVVGKVLYLKGATGGFTKLPAALAGEVYDPTAILQAEKGVAAVLRHIITPGNPTLVGSSYTITGTVPKAAAAALVPGITSDAMGTFTIDKASSRLTDVVLHLAGSDGKPAAVDLALSDFNKAVTVSAPA